ncbi:Eco57I restriction-modification methylase domain-containing protein [Chloroflexota bacterium]
MTEIKSNDSSTVKPQLAFVNRGLFSDHFIQERLPAWKEWGVDAELTPFHTGLKALFEAKKPFLVDMNEAQTEDEFIKPILDLLGYADNYIVQASTKLGKQTSRPDYALFPDKATKDQAYTKIKDNDYTQCIGIADAKYWERELDLAKSSERDTFTNLNPSFQIAGYLTGTKQNWGILTNGRLWRLYSTKSHLPLGNYYQVDLVQLLEEAPAEVLKYFYVFFRKEALLRVDDKSFLDRVLEGSEEYAVELEADIKERAYDVVELLCRGFAADFTDGKVNDANLKDIYDNSLTLLYRLLFVFYAEARELLPLTANASYRDNYSLRRLAHDIDEVFKKGYELSSGSTQYYHQIKTLFNLIDKGDLKLGVPEYNGGLFDPQEHHFLETHAIPDSHLVKAIHQLARITDKKLKREVVVDYNTLSERHLGSIYEGLLEFRPRIAPHDLVVIKDKGSTKYAPASKQSAKKIAFHKGELYLVNNKGERKASGSYYTPEYIVNYIIENTLDPLVKEAHEKVKALKPEVDKEIAKWQDLKEQKKALEPIEKYDRAISEEQERLLTPYLFIKVLDPAMGSGHFLSRATDFLAEAIATDPSIESPLELSEESELTYYRRRVVESCIYGVDLNPLAVELAKLTLWLTTMARSKPLSFLNHHLRVGNSLIGARIADLDEIPKTKGKKKSIDLSRAPIQLGLFQIIFNQKLYDLLQNRALIAKLPTETLEDVHNKQKWEKDFEHNIKRFRTLADVWVSTFFGNEVSWDSYNTLIEKLQSPESEWEKLIPKKYVQKALANSEEKRFFHWELEFPEVFFGPAAGTTQVIELKEKGGFDAVVGNPPYVDLKGMDPILVDYYFAVFTTAENRLNIFAFFIDQAVRLVQESKGYTGFIIPTVMLVQASYQRIREIILRSTSITSIVRLPSELFGKSVGEVKVDTMILCLKRGYEPSNVANVLVYTGFERINDIKASTTSSFLQVPQCNWLNAQASAISLTAGSKQEEILFKLRAASEDLETMCEFCLGLTPYDKYSGHTKEQIEERVFHATQRLGKTYKPLLESGDVDRYIIEWNGHEWINYGDWLAAPREPRFFQCRRILVNQIVDWTTRRIKAGLIEDELYNTQNAFNLLPIGNTNLAYILALLNSTLMNFVHEKTFLDEAKMRFQKVLIKDARRFPIRRISFVTSNERRKVLVERGRKLYEADSSGLATFVKERLVAQPEESDVVHDLLAFLAEEMTRLNKEKQEKIKDFLIWLEKEIIKGSIEDQKNKTKIKSFHEGTVEELIDVLKKNKSIPDPCPSNIWNTLNAEYSAAMTELTPLKDHIKETDKLIDQIIYKLYKLSGEEIAIVEGKGAS